MDEENLTQLLDWVRNRYFGKYRGKVVSNANDKRGRLLVEVPAVLGSEKVWAMPCVPYAGKGVGFYSLPEPESGVWIEFEAGDPSYPIWTGCFWADDELPDGSKADVKVWKTAQLTLRLDDGGKQLRAESSSGANLSVDAAVTAEVKDKKIKHVVSSSGLLSEAGSGGGKIEVSTGKLVKVNDSALEVT